MNTSMLLQYAPSQLAKYLRKVSCTAQNIADDLEVGRHMTPLQRTILQRNLVYNQKHKGKAGFVIVNGPSLAQQDLSILKNSITYCVSGFWKHHVIDQWQPTYYSLLDKSFFEESESQNLFYKSLNHRIQKSTFFLPLYRGYDAVRQQSLLPADQCYYVAAVGSGKVIADLANIVQSFAGVSAFALAQAIYMGCNPIYLLGFDHDYLANRGVDRHFYSGGTMVGHKWTNLPIGDRVPYDVEMKNNFDLWQNYRNLKVEAEKKGILILNATTGGYLDVFDRIDYNRINLF